MVLGFLDGSRNFDSSTAPLAVLFASDVTFPSLMMSFHFSSFSRSDLPWISILTMDQVPSSSAKFFASWPTAWARVKASIPRNENARSRGVIDLLLLWSNDLLHL